MTKAEVVFDPFSEDTSTTRSTSTDECARRRPLYYDEKEDFYALTRHVDVAAALKDHETYSSSRGCDLAMVRKGISSRHEVHHLHGSAGPPAHAQPAQQGLHPAGRSIAEGDVHEVIDKYLGAVDPDRIRRGAGLLRTVPGRGHHPDGRRARGIPPTGAALDRHQPAPGAGTDRASARPACRPTSTPRCTTSAWCRNGGRTRRTT